jgi:hypothetical protein
VTRRPLCGIALIAAIVALAHLGLWTSDKLTPEAKWTLTRINLTGWAVILLPAIGVHLWLRARLRDR